MVTLGLWGIWRRRQRFIVTTQRVIVTRGILLKSLATVCLSKVQDTTLEKLANARKHLCGLLEQPGGPLDIGQVPDSGVNSVEFSQRR